MRRISQREMRNQSAEVLRSVEAGESLIVTNRSRPVAVLSPYIESETPLERLRAEGRTRPPQTSRDALRALVPQRLDVTSEELLRETRGDR